MERRTIAEVMTPAVVRVGPGTPFKEITALLAEHHISGLPVTDPDGRVVGVISETDLSTRQARLYQGIRTGRGRFRMPWRSRAERAADAKARGLTARELMSAPPVTVHPGDSLVAAARTMEQHRIERLPVVDTAGRLVGIVTRRDLLRIFLRPDEEIRDEVVHDVLGRTLWLAPSAVRVTVEDGVVTLEGRLERRSKIPFAVGLTRQVDGVVAVVDRLGWRIDDTGTRPPQAVP